MAEAKAEDFAAVRPIFDFDRTWDEAAYEARADHTVESLTADMGRVLGWETELGEMRPCWCVSASRE